MDYWVRLGFKSNPYVVKPLPASREGYELLVGRTKELDELLKRLRNSDRHLVLEGANGVGKTSLVLVAAWKALDDWMDERSDQLLIPLGEPLQIREDVSRFVDECYFAIAQAFLKHHHHLTVANRDVPEVSDVKKWLNDPTYSSSVGGGASAVGFGISGSFGTGLNTSAGFTQSGFQATVRRWMNEAFPPGSGGFVGVIDNLELIDTSADAQDLLERLRDPVLQLSGMRWVLCGARGIARSLAATPRLNGVLASPIDINPVAHSDIPELVRARIKQTRLDPSSQGRVPVTAESFEYLYDVSHQNLRDSLGYAQDFALNYDAEFFINTPAGDVKNELVEWTDRLAVAYAGDIALQARVWKFLQDLADAGGTCSPGDHESFGFNDRTHMRKNVVDLERFGLVESSRDEVDQRRRSIAITSKGWLVVFARAKQLIGDVTLPGLTPGT
jgi:DNA-binding MarR family transcriptional regulator